MKKTVFDDTGLKAYRAKRNFHSTNEPKPHVAKTPKKQKPPLFVIQKHDASRLHYDFRLEMDGVLKSWAVPKGIPMKRGEKHLAIQVEDHPLDYANFEGTIPEGNYGAGTVMVWDTGTYEVAGVAPLIGLKEGKLHLKLSGKKLKGEWALVRTKIRSGNKESWLLFKGEVDAKPLSKKLENESALTKRSLEKIASDNDAQWGTSRKSASPPRGKNKVVSKTLRAELKGGRKREVGFIPPMKCRPAKTPPTGSEWIYEIKFDGIRSLSIKRSRDVELLSRAKNDLTERFPTIAEAIRGLPCRDCVLDGEIVALDKEGRSSFQLLQMASVSGEPRAPLCFYAFDLLNLDGTDLTGFPLARRKAILQSLVQAAPKPIRFSADIRGDPKKLLGEIRKRGLEGIVAKRTDSKYEADLRTGSWVKIKVVNAQEFVIGGYTTPKGSRDFFGAILVGYFEKKKLIFASKVGSGFNQTLLESLHQKFQKLQRDECPFENLPEKRSGRFGQGFSVAEMKRCHWVQPKLVAQIHFAEWTRDGHLRQPVFAGLREDKKATEVVKESL